METVKSIFREWVIPMAIAVIAALLINKFIFFNIKVPSESMYPTIKIGDRMIAMRVHNVKNLKREDIVVFYSDELHEDLIKRLIGLPGDKVEVKPDGTYVNDKKLDDSYVVEKGGKLGSFVVPEGKYLFLGDNRANSRDSRYWINPFIDAKAIKGKAVIRTYPFNRLGKIK